MGTYFADGGLTSTGTPSAPSINETLDRDTGDKDGTSILNKQLLLEGTLFTRNTLGGGMMEPFIDPWGAEMGATAATTDRAKAQRYDLHFVRRYYEKVRLGPGGSVVTNPGDCLNTDGTNCDPNKHAFVIRPDGRVLSVPPPGFEQ